MAGTIGGGRYHEENFSEYTHFIIGLSWDFVAFSVDSFYVGLGIGPFIREHEDARVSSKLVFGEKLFFGLRLNDTWSGEFFVQHFSNGDLTESNHGFNFVGLTAAMNF